MNKYRLLGVYREKRFSPGTFAEKDAAVLREVLLRFGKSNLPLETRTICGEDLPAIELQPDLVLTMAQSEESLQKLGSWNLECKIVNSVAGVRNCYRELMVPVLSEASVMFPMTVILSLDDLEHNRKIPFPYPVWLKRGDVHAMEEGDVVRIDDKEMLPRVLGHFRRRNITRITVQEHVEGEVYKFYGVGRGDFFRVYPEKKGDKVTAGWINEMQRVAIRAAEVLGLEVYGGDAVIDSSGKICLIDMNDWPSFSPCRKDAAEAIFRYVTDKWQLT